MASIVHSIVADIFPLQVRGRVMGFLQMAFAVASVLGLPVGLYLANQFGWHAPFLMIVGTCLIILIFIVLYMKPVSAHLVSVRPARGPVEHLINTGSNPEYARAFIATILMATGGFMLMPFGSAFAVYNNRISLTDLPLLYAITGVCALFIAPMVGKLADVIGKYKVFSACSTVLILSVGIYCNLGITPFHIVAIFSVLIFCSYAGRMVASSALITAVPSPEDRGAFMSINSSINMVSGGIASLIAGAVVHRQPSGRIENYDILGYVVGITIIISMVMLYFVNQLVKEKRPAKFPTTPPADNISVAN